MSAFISKSEEGKRKAKRAAIIGGSALGGAAVGNIPMTLGTAQVGHVLGSAGKSKTVFGLDSPKRGAAIGAGVAQTGLPHAVVLEDVVRRGPKKGRIFRSPKSRVGAAGVALLPVAGAVTGGAIATQKTKVKKSEDESKESMAHEKTEGCGCKMCEEKDLECKDCPKCSGKRIHL